MYMYVDKSLYCCNKHWNLHSEETSKLAQRLGKSSCIEYCSWCIKVFFTVVKLSLHVTKTLRLRSSFVRLDVAHLNVRRRWRVLDGRKFLLPSAFRGPGEGRRWDVVELGRSFVDFDIRNRHWGGLWGESHFRLVVALLASVLETPEAPSNAQGHRDHSQYQQRDSPASRLRVVQLGVVTHADEHDTEEYAERAQDDEGFWSQFAHEEVAEGWRHLYFRLTNTLRFSLLFLGFPLQLRVDDHLRALAPDVVTSCWRRRTCTHRASCQHLQSRLQRPRYG